MASLRSSKRIYTTAALEGWFGRLTGDWEAAFSDEALERGRRLYRNSQVRQIEMSEADAIVHARFNGEDCYAMVDWQRGCPSIRSSTRDTLLGQSLAAAGLYEIEELIADEIPALPAEASDEPPGADGSNGTEAPTAEAPPVAPPRPLVLHFHVDVEGLRFRAHWQGTGSAGRKPALGDEAARALQAVAAPPPSPAEREKLIRLASLARRAGFTFNPALCAYSLADFDAVARFARESLPDWERYFIIERDAEVDRLAEGPADITLTAEARQARTERAGSLDLDFRLQLGGEELGEGLRRRLLRTGGGVRFLRGRGLVRLGERDAALLREWRQRPARDLPRYLLFSLAARESLNLELTPELRQWRESVLRLQPEAGDLPGFLRGYQAAGVRWLAHLAAHGCHGLLADEMGLGKTVQVLTLLERFPVEGLPALIVCPASVVPVWQKELACFFPHRRARVLRGGDTFEEPVNGSEPPFLWLASYTQLRRHRALLDAREFGYAVLDEGQFIKNPEAKVTQACLAIRARRRVVLTGTPLENRPADLWTLFRFLMPGLLGPRRALEESLAKDNGGRAAARLRRQIAPFILRRTKREVAAELPEKSEFSLACPLTPRQRTEYARIAGEGLGELGDDLAGARRGASMHLLALLTRLRQACCDPGLLPGSEAPPHESGKLAVLADRLGEVAATGKKAVVFSQFTTLIDRAQALLDKVLPGLPRHSLTGATSDRASPVAAFQEAAGPAVMFVSLRAGGTGITLHAAEYVFLLDPWWNPAVEQQAIDRVHRIGQENPVTVYRLIADGTLEERIQRLKEHKRGLFDTFVGSLDDQADLENHFASLSQLIELTDQG